MIKNIKVRFSRKFRKQYAKTEIKIRNSFDKRLELFLKDPFHPLLNNHQLTGELLGFRSINVTGDWRAFFKEASDPEIGEIIIFEVLGTHSQLYR